MGGIPQCVKENETGFLFPKEDHQALSAKIIDFFELDDADKSRLSGNSREFVSGRFSWKSAAQKTIAVFENRRSSWATPELHAESQRYTLQCWYRTFGFAILDKAAGWFRRKHERMCSVDDGALAGSGGMWWRRQ